MTTSALLAQLQASFIGCKTEYPTVDGKRAAAVEILLGTPTVSEMIKNGDIGGLKVAMDKSEGLGMRTFDSALYYLYKSGSISKPHILKFSYSLR